MSLEKGSRAAVTAIFLFVMALGLTGDGSGLGGGHAKTGDCKGCHLTDPEKQEGQRRPLFMNDFTVMCTQCHPGAKALSHPVDIAGMKGAPAIFPLDWKGQMTCVTCHFFHNGRNPLFLRAGKAGKEFCLMCHDMKFFRGMRDRGEALSGAHLEARSAAPAQYDFVDEVSIACLSCHDGTVSIDVVGDMTLSAGFVSHSRGSSHPIGVEYAEKSMRDDSYAPQAILPPEIHLPNGRLGCVSCHAPYKEEHGSLVMSNERSRLCLTCHKK